MYRGMFLFPDKCGLYRIFVKHCSSAETVLKIEKKDFSTFLFFFPFLLYSESSLLA